MTAPADLYAFTPSPERAWQLAAEEALRLNEQTKVNALIWAAQCAQTDFRFIAGDNWVIIRRRLMHSSTQADDFMTLCQAVAEGDPTRVRQAAEALVFRS